MIDLKSVKKETWYLTLVGIISFCLVCIYFYFNFFNSEIVKDENGKVVTNDASPINLSVPNAGIKNDSLSIIDKIDKLKDDSITKSRINKVGIVENDNHSDNRYNSNNIDSRSRRSNVNYSSEPSGNSYSRPRNVSNRNQNLSRSIARKHDNEDNNDNDSDSDESFFNAPTKHNSESDAISSGTDDLFTDKKIYASIHNNQIIKDNSRIKIRLTKNTVIDGVKYPTNTIIYGLAKLQLNRMFIDITSVNQNQISDLEVYDAEDSNKGIYVETPILNASLKKEIGNDALQEDMSRIPFSRTLSSFLQKKIKEERIELLDNYKLIIKKKSE